MGPSLRLFLRAPYDKNGSVCTKFDFCLYLFLERMKSQAQLEKFLWLHKSNPAVKGLFMGNSGPHVSHKSLLNMLTLFVLFINKNS